MPTKKITRRTAHKCPECDSEVLAPALLVETAQTIEPIEKPRGFVCSDHCGWETMDVSYFAPKDDEAPAPPEV